MMDHSAMKACLVTLRRSFSYDKLIESYVMAVLWCFSCWTLGLSVSLKMGIEQWASRRAGVRLAVSISLLGQAPSSVCGAAIFCPTWDPSAMHESERFCAVSISEFDSVIRAVSLEPRTCTGDPTKSADDRANDASCQAQNPALHHSYRYFRSPNFVQILRI